MSITLGSCCEAALPIARRLHYRHMRYFVGSGCRGYRGAGLSRNTDLYYFEDGAPARRPPRRIEPGSFSC